MFRLSEIDRPRIKVDLLATSYNLLRGQARIALRYSLISTTVLSDRASAHLVLQYSLICVTTLSINASALLFCATAPQYCIVPSGTYCVVSYLFLITGLGSQTII